MQKQNLHAINKYSVRLPANCFMKINRFTWYEMSATNTNTWIELQDAAVRFLYRF